MSGVRTHVRRLVSDAVLRRTSFETVSLAADRLLVLPQATRVKRAHVVEPLRQRGHLKSVDIFISYYVY